MTCLGETCHVQPECSCSKTERSYITCSSVCGPYIPKFGTSTVQFQQLSVTGSRETTTIRDGTFGELKVKRLRITQTGIDEISCQAFAGLDLGLETIVLYGNYLNSVPNCSLARFESVTYLDLSNNRITSIPTDSFASFTLLQTLYLEQNRIESIEPGAFHGLGKLTTLYLYNNELVYLDASTFMGADSLTTLQLSNNNISSIHVRAFDGLGKLTNLQVTFNNLTYLDNTVFHTTGELLYLYMDNNNLTELGGTLFSKSKKLRDLTARNNKIKRISDATFTGLDKLQSLYLDNNWLKDLRQQWFTDTITLRDLRLSRNNITEVNKGTFQTLGNLTDLRLEHNEIRVIEKDVFKGLRKVNTIFLNNNRLTEIRKDNFIHCPVISRIDLSFNIIQDVYQGSFRNLSRLYRIDLSGNRIPQIVTGTFSNVTRLSTLSLNDNRVSFISDRLFENMEPSLRTLELRNNGWSSSSWIWFAKVMVNLTRLNTLDLSNNPLSTIPTDVLPTLENIDTVKMRNCSIQFITNDSVSIFNYKWDVRENTISTYTSIQGAYLYGNVNVSHNLIPALNVDVLDGYRYGGIIADNNKIQNGFTLTLLSPYVDSLSISLRNNLIEKGIQISALDVTPDSLTVEIETLDLSNNKLTKVNLFPVKLLHQLSWNPCNSSFGSVNQLRVRTLNLSNNAISVISAAACLGSVYTLDLRNNRLEVLGDFLTSIKSPGFRMNSLYLSGNRIHRVSPNAFDGITNHYFTLDLRDNKLVSLENIQPIIEKFQSLRLSLSGNPLACGCEIDWLRNDSIRQKLDSVRCQTPRSAFRYLSWCFPLTGCQDTMPMSFTAATRKICEMDSNLELSNLSVTASKGVSNVTWTKIGPGVITGFRLELHSDDEVESRNSFLVHHDVNYAILTNLVEGKTYNICVTAELASPSGGSVCIQTSLSLVEAFSSGLPLVAGLGSAVGICVIIALLTIICLTCRQSKPNIFQQNTGPVSPPPAISIINGQNLNAFTPNPGYGERESDDNLYEDVKDEECENTGFNA
ncbi:protein artichoke-like [Liolophura sinensis]|uniref:protein artichoke-like n=1 Tax=Liolophura sinensis TaxID=3198878 RepID=UPI0031586127